MQELKVLELFAGLGACSKALERLNIPHEIVDAVEIDKYAIQSFNAIHETDFEPQDITTWDKNIDVDLIMHGSPCQDFSLAGKQAGGDEGSGTRSSLMYETIRIVEKLKPKYVLWENVKNLLSKKHRHNFDAYLETLEQLGYKNYYQVLNAKDYGIPQSRERVFTISIRNDIDKNFHFPEKQPLELRLKDLLDNKVKDIAPTQSTQCGSATSSSAVLIRNKSLRETLEQNNIEKDISFIDSYNRNIRKDDLSGTITTRVSDSNNTFIAIKPDDECVTTDLRIRKLTPKECWMLMGFDGVDFEKAEKINSNTQLYKQAGNSIVVNVLEAIFKELFGEYIQNLDKWSDLD
jgi:DNA (cytosine-5)-methyltransferase 1